MHKKLRNRGEAVKEKNEKQRISARTRGENAQVFTQNGEEDEKSSRLGEENRHAFLLFRFIPCGIRFISLYLHAESLCAFGITGAQFPLSLANAVRSALRG